MIISENFSIKKYNTFGIDTSAKYFAGFNSIEQLQALTERFAHEKIMILGGGSNVLFTKDFNGIVLRNEIKGIHIIDEDPLHYYLRAGSGEIWHQFVMHCINNNYAGVENLSLIPGFVGASPMQNIGAYGVEIKDVFHSLEAFHLKDKSMVTYSKQDCAFGYRESVFKNQYKNQFVITSVTYKLYKKPSINTSYGAIKQELESMQVSSPGIQDVSQAVINIRSSKLPDPLITGNAGSFFKNPVITKAYYEELLHHYPELPHYPAPEEAMVKVPAGWLIEKAGWKGYRKNDYGVHNRQALVLVNYGTATGKEIFDLSENIIADIQNKFSILLEREVNIL